MNELVLAAKAFADPTRVRILAALRGRELCVCELCDALGMGQSTLSTHLRVIRDAGLVTTRRQGKWIYYAPSASMEPLVAAVFGRFARAVESDPLLRRDATALRRRLAQRDEGLCCRGFSQQGRPLKTACR